MNTENRIYVPVLWPYRLIGNLLLLGMIWLVTFTIISVRHNLVSRHIDSLISELYQSTATIGWGIDDITVEGRNKTSKKDILNVINLDRDDNILEVDLNDLGEKIKTLPNGADTVLTREFDETGAGLSGGETQKTAVARMFAKDFDVAMLDEPSSALDPIAEYRMYENLIQATKNKTVIYISHRLSSAVLSDNIFVLKGGTVIESGTHSELMELGGDYCSMFTLQASRYKGEGEENYA